MSQIVYSEIERAINKYIDEEILTYKSIIKDIEKEEKTSYFVKSIRSKKYLKLIEKLSYLKSMIHSYLSSIEFNISFLQSDNISKEEKLEKIDFFLKTLKEKIDISKELKKFKLDRYSDIDELLKRVNYSSKHVESSLFRIAENSFSSLIDQTNKLIQEKISQLQTKRIEIIEGKKVLKKSEIDLEKDAETQHKVASETYSFSKEYDKIIKYLEEISKANSNNLLEKMRDIKISTANAIIICLNSSKDDSFHNVEKLIDIYSKIYKMFIKKFNKLNSAQKEIEIQNYKKKYNLKEFDLKNFDKENMIEYANNDIINKMIKSLSTYNTTLENEFINPVKIIISKIRLMSFEKIKEAYDKLKKENQKYNFDSYNLQQNFIISIYRIMFENGMIKKEQILDDSLKKKICEEILKDSYIDQIEKHSVEEKKR